jgi:hypothetical protein
VISLLACLRHLPHLFFAPCAMLCWQKIMLLQKRFPKDIRHFMVMKRVISSPLSSALIDEIRCRAILWFLCNRASEKEESLPSVSKTLVSCVRSSVFFVSRARVTSRAHQPPPDHQAHVHCRVLVAFSCTSHPGSVPNALHRRTIPNDSNGVSIRAERASHAS